MAQQPPASGIGQIAICAPQQRLDPAHQLAQAKRLGHVVVGAELQADDLVHLLVAGGQDQDRCLGAARAEASQNLEAVDARQADVQDYEIRSLAEGELEAFLTGSRDRDLITLLLEGVLDSPGDGVFVLDDQDRGSHKPILHPSRRDVGGDPYLPPASALRSGPW